MTILDLFSGTGSSTQAFAARLDRSRRMYESGEESARAVIASGGRIALGLLRAYPPADRSSYLLGAANACRSLIVLPAKSPAHRRKLSAAMTAYHACRHTRTDRPSRADR